MNAVSIWNYGCIMCVSEVWSAYSFGLASAAISRPRSVIDARDETHPRKIHSNHVASKPDYLSPIRSS